MTRTSDERLHGRRAWLVRAALALAMTLFTGRAWADAAPPERSTALEAALDRAEASIRVGAFDEAAAVLRDAVAAEPTNRRARELLAFALESVGDVDAEREVRSRIATEAPGDAQAQRDFARVLERSGNFGGALAAYRSAKALSPGRPDAELRAAIDRMAGRTAVEVAAAISARSDPDAQAWRLQAGTAVPVGSGHVALLAAHETATDRTGGGAVALESLAAIWALRHRSGASLSLGPRLYGWTLGSAATEAGIGGSLAAGAPLGSVFEAEANGDLGAPWDEAALTVLHGGRVSSAGGRLYAHALSRRLLVQVGARGRQLSIAAPNGFGANDRPQATQTLLLGGADLVVWRDPASTVRGEMLDDALTAPAGLSSAVTVGYRHYEVFTQTSFEFVAVIDLAPRASVDEASASALLSLAAGHVGLEVRGGLGRDHARAMVLWRAEGGLYWAPTAAVRLALRYYAAVETALGLAGERHAGWVSCHVDL